MSSRLLALAVCTLCLLSLLGLSVFIESPSFDRLTHADPRAFGAGFSLHDLVPPPGEGGLAQALEKNFAKTSFAPLVALVLVILLVLDTHTIFQRYANYRRVRQPADNPLGFALMRVRRCLFVPIAIAWLMAYCRATGFEAKVAGEVLFVVAVILARRGENDTYGTMFQYACELASKFCEGFSGRR